MCVCLFGSRDLFHEETGDTSRFATRFPCSKQTPRRFEREVRRKTKVGRLHSLRLTWKLTGGGWKLSFWGTPLSTSMFVGGRVVVHRQGISGLSMVILLPAFVDLHSDTVGGANEPPKMHEQGQLSTLLVTISTGNSPSWFDIVPFA